MRWMIKIYEIQTLKWRIAEMSIVMNTINNTIKYNKGTLSKNLYKFNFTWWDSQLINMNWLLDALMITQLLGCWLFKFLLLIIFWNTFLSRIIFKFVKHSITYLPSIVVSCEQLRNPKVLCLKINSKIKT